jgi:hypothetical protein
MAMSVKISDELLRDAREEAKATDRSITSQIEHWVRLGRKVERDLRHDEVVAIKRSADDDPLVQSMLAKIRRIADSDHSDLAKELLASGPVYQSAPAAASSASCRTERAASGTSSGSNSFPMSRRRKRDSQLSAGVVPASNRVCAFRARLQPR